MGNLAIMGLPALAALMWGANFNLAVPVVAEMHPLTAAALRFALAALVMMLIAKARGERVPLMRHAKAYAVLGGIGIAGFNLPFFMGMQATSPVNGSLIMATNPLVTALLAALVLKERPSRRQLLALPVALAGVAAVVLGGRAGAGAITVGRGDLLIMAANLAWAGYTVLGKRLMPPAPAIANTAAIMAMGTVVLALAAVMVQAPVSLPGPKAAAALAAMTVGGSAVAYLCWNVGLARLGASRTAPFINLVPVATMVIAAAAGTPPSAAQLTGGAVVLAVVVFAMLPARPAPKRTLRPPAVVLVPKAFSLSPGKD